VFVRLDVTDTGVIAAAAAFIQQAYGQLDILVNNAGIKVNALAPGFVATALNNHTGTDTVEQAGARIASQVLLPDDGPTGVFLREGGGTYPW
jgi:NAD(P)-dependent dehydrogenase (short-subunit alcohol dehydrogenase family)